MVSEELRELFQRVVPPAPRRPRGGGRRRHGGRAVLAAITFAATTGCTWQQLPPGLDRWGRRCIVVLPTGRRPQCSGWCPMN
ncbi:transposase [Actinomadura litoris]|uniref:Transposase n=1 Tax=Actinomadura litoris TaxID=2678616 RepID=A0A7K1KTB1_9ACTN|nr:transposase [Actinomadura litoris]